MAYGLKLAADRQPSGGSASESLSGALESSFVEASRRAENLLRDDPPKVSEPPSQTPAEALSTVVLKPEEMKRMVDRARDRAEQEEGVEPESGADQGGALGGGMAAESPPAEAAVATPAAPARGTDEAVAEQAAPPATSPPSAAEETPPEPEPSLLNMDRAVLQSAAEDDFGYPQEDRTPMMIVGGIVLLIVVGLVLWLILT